METNPPQWHPHLPGVLVVLFFTILFKVLSSLYGFDWRFAAAFSYVLCAAFLFYGVVFQNGSFLRLFLLGLVSGFVELLSDRYLVVDTLTLVYHSDEPMLVASPLYMPFAWAAIITQIGYLAYILTHKHTRIWVATLVAAGLGALILPSFEHWASVSGWWYYQNCRMILDVPYYIICSEILVAAILPWMMRMTFNRPIYWALVFGVLHGLWIWFTAFLGIQFFE